MTPATGRSLKTGSERWFLPGVEKSWASGASSAASSCWVRDWSAVRATMTSVGDLPPPTIASAASR